MVNPQSLAILLKIHMIARQLWLKFSLAPVPCSHPTVVWLTPSWSSCSKQPPLSISSSPWWLALWLLVPSVTSSVAHSTIELSVQNRCHSWEQMLAKSQRISRPLSSWPKKLSLFQQLPIWRPARRLSPLLTMLSQWSILPTDLSAWSLRAWSSRSLKTRHSTIKRAQIARRWCQKLLEFKRKTNNSQ